MPLKKGMFGDELLTAEGILYNEWAQLTDCQKRCTERVGMSLQMEQEAYLSQHPEVLALLKVFVSQVPHPCKGHLKAAAKFFSRPVEELDRDARTFLKLPPHVHYSKLKQNMYYHWKPWELEADLDKIIRDHNPPPPWVIPSSSHSTLNTESSSFISKITSDTTVPTPEPVPIPPPTLTETFYMVVSDVVDKAIYQRVDDGVLKYDTAYVEVQKAVERAMEIPVIGIREDIANLLCEAWHFFNLEINEQERIAAEIRWAKRMRKKMKKTLRRQDDFKGYETPPSPKSTASTHSSYLVPPPKPCKCNPQFHYNRYKKDRFGIYLPIDEEFCKENTTLTPVISAAKLDEEQPENKTD